MTNDLTARETQGLLATLVAAPVVFLILFTALWPGIGGDIGLLLSILVATAGFAAVPYVMARVFAGAPRPSSMAGLDARPAH